VLIPIPVGTEAPLTRLPRATIALIVLNVLVFILSLRPGTSASLSKEQEIARLADWAFTKAGEDQPEVKRLRAEFSTALALLRAPERWDRVIADQEIRRQLLGYLTEDRELKRDHPFERFGWVPARPSLPALLGHMFLHGDLVHLAFNMLFLWVAGAVLEEAWGSGLFLGAYFAAGVAAALTHAVANAHSSEPAIGASGAVAGLMGAFLVVHTKTRIRVALVSAMALAPRTYFMSLPAWVLLGAWFAQQVFWALLTTKTSVGVAFAAHLGGFAFGCLTGAAMKAAGVMGASSGT